jgi:hypothetical protein
LIVTKFVKVGVNWKTEAHYKRLGYDTNGRVLTVRYSHLPPASTVVIYGECDLCRKKFREQYHRIFRNRVGYKTGDKDYCRDCISSTSNRSMFNFSQQKFDVGKQKIWFANEKFKTDKKSYTKGFYIYRFIDKKGKIIYIGLTSQKLDYRLSQHFNGGHLPGNCYQSVDAIEYSRVNSASEMRIYEIYLINKHSPEFNVEFNRAEHIGFSLPELTWTSYPKTTHKNYEESFAS